MFKPEKVSVLIRRAGFLFLLIFAVVRAQDYRVEKDLLGEKKIPAEAYYGIQTLRALENFQISGITPQQYPTLIKAFAMVKLAAARANHEADPKKMPKEVLNGIEKACKAIMNGKYHDQFVVDLYQGGAGTSANMNANEVIANVALEMIGKKKGEYEIIEPHDHVNLSQSTNDYYPTALKTAMILKNEALLREMDLLRKSFEKKAAEFDEILKMGRTELQDAVPMTVGQEFRAFASAMKNEIATLKEAEKHLYVINMGGTAIGTKLNSLPGFVEGCARQLGELLHKPIVPAEDLVYATSDLGSFVVFSAALNSLAVRMSKTANDLILLSSGPRTGLFEINLPTMQPGSSIMPGKVNPVIPELMNLVSLRVMANNLAVDLAAKSGQLQLNAYEPLALSAIMESQKLLTNTLKTFRVSCVDGITVNKKVVNSNIEKSIGIVTALNPVLGYDKSTELAAEALKTGKGILELVREKKLLTEEQIKKVLDPKKMTGQ
jgi:aspartate ammonia-lyase